MWELKLECLVSVFPSLYTDWVKTEYNGDFIKDHGQPSNTVSQKSFGCAPFNLTKKRNRSEISVTANY